MSDSDTDRSSSDGLVLTPKVALIFAIGVPAMFFLFDDVLGLFENGGLFSVWSALQAASARAAAINVDDAGLRTIFVLLCSIVVSVPSAALRANLSNRFISFAIIIPIVAGGFIFDGIYDESVVGHLLAAHGYRRCENGDFHVGNGKSRVWFDSYVLSQSSCPSKPPKWTG